MADANPSPPRRRRWLRWFLILAVVAIVAAGVVVGVIARRVRPQLERTLSDALRMDARIEGLALQPWLGSASLVNLRIGSDADVLGAARITITPRYETLWRHDIVIERIAVQGLHGVLHLDENYQPAFQTALTGERAGTPGTYHVTVRELVVEGGELTVRYPVRAKPRDGKLQITHFRAANLHLGRTAGPALDMSGSFAGAFDGAAIEATTDVRLSDAEPSIAFDFSLSGLRVSRETLTLPAQLDTLTGTLDVQATLGEGGGVDEHGLRFTIRVADAGLTGKEGSALSAKRIVLPSARVDMAEQRIDLGPVTIEGPTLAVRLTPEGLVLPFTPAAGGADSDWTVTSGEFVTRDGTLRVLRSDTTTVMRLASLRVDGLQAKGNSTFRLDAAVDDGTIVANGTVNPDTRAATVEARLDTLPLPTLAQLVDGLPLGLARGSASGELQIRYGQALERFAGRLELNDVHTLPPSPERSSEILAVSGAQAEFTFTNQPEPVLDIASLELSYPYIMVQRHADNVFPYSLLSASATAPAGRAAARPPAVRIDRIEVAGGKIEFLDTTMQPTFWSAFTDLAFSASALRLPENTIGEFTFKGKHDEISPTQVSGSLTDQGLKAEALLQDILIETLNAYVSPALGYRFTAGRLTSTATTTPAPPLLKSTADIVLRGIDLIQTGPDIVQEQSGVPLPVALNLISNLAGEVRLTVPLAIDTEFQTVSFGNVFWQAVRHAIISALTSPLRLLGSLFGTKGAPHAFAIDPIPFPAGSARPDRAGLERIEQIRRILTAHPGLLLVLLPQVTESEMRAAGAGAATLAEARNAAARDAFLSAADPLPLERVILAPWKPDTGAKATGKPGVYVELQDAP